MKTPKAIGLAAALAALVLVPAAAVSQGKKDAEIPAAARKSGMAEAPALVQAAGLPCQVSDARKIGEDKKTKTGYYEVACATGTPSRMTRPHPGLFAADRAALVCCC